MGSQPAIAPERGGSMESKIARRAFSVVLTGLLLAAGAGPSHGQDASFLPAPELEARLERALGEAGRHAVLPPAAPPGDGRYADLRGEEIHRDLARLTEFSLESRRSGQPIWGRVMGTPAERRAAEWVRDRFRALGLEQVELTPVPLEPQWTLREVGLTLRAGEGDSSVPLASAMAGYGSPSTPPEGIEAPLVYVGLGTPADLRDRDLKGKIALVHSRALAGASFHTGESAVSRIVAAGDAVGVIVMVDQPGNAQVLTRNGPDGPKLPNLSVGFLDGTYLRKAIEHAPADAPARVRMRIRAERVEGLASVAVSAMLPGQGDEVLGFQAHLDGYWQAVTDNGGGVATVLALARHYAARPKHERRRSLLFLVTGGHENGSVGASHFARHHRELLARTTLVLELEHVASTLVSGTIGGHYQPTSIEAPVGIFVTNRSPAVLSALRAASEHYAIPVNQDHLPFYWGDIIGLMPTGVPCAGWIGSNFYYHSSLDSLEAVRPRSLERIARATASVVDALDAMDRKALEAGSTPFVMPKTYEGADKELMSPLRVLLEFTRSLW
ncbi:MAG: M28 family peptidase [Deltaproteobacteria bacterium]|nr:M28 family peptidase [Deltaproteobacteria bacterium]MBW2448145.1 M28 family peptidase [Deltaproteobacteria bacterium]